MPRSQNTYNMDQQPNFLSKIFSSFRKIFRNSKNQTIHSETNDPIEKLEYYANTISVKEKDILSNFLGFCNKTVDDVKIPRSDISSISSTTNVAALNKKILETGHTRTLVYEDNLDNIIGFLHIKDIFKAMVNKSDVNIQKLIRTPILAAQSMKLIDLLTEMQRTRTHIAIVVDEYGGTDGIATIEDIMETLVGEIEDEHDNNNDPKYEILKTGEIITEARVEIEELEKAIGTALKTEEDVCETIGGLILSRIGHIPEKNTTIIISDNISATVIDADSRVIKKIKLVVS